METVNFAWNEFENLSNFSAHQIEYNSIIFPTCEHLYHYLRYWDTEIQDKILTARSPSLVYKISQEFKNKQIDWFNEIKIKL